MSREKLVRPVPRIFAAELLRPNSRDSNPRDFGPLYLDKNENSDPRLREWLQSLLGHMPDGVLSTYPDLGPLYSALSQWLGVPSEQLVLTAGCDGAIQRTFEMFVDAGDRVLLTKPTFAMYPVYGRAFGAEISYLTYTRSDTGPILDFEMVLETVGRLEPRLFCLPNPDSPTGHLFTISELTRIADLCAETGTILLIDEAYYPFSAITAAPLVSTRPNVLVARTFSKAWGMAGLRAGYLIGYPETIEWFHKTRPMYEIGGFANGFLLAALDEPENMQASVVRLNAGKQVFENAMTSLGFQVLPSVANFQHISFGNHASKVHEALAGQVSYRIDSEDECLKGFSRFSSTTPELFAPIIRTITASF